ncbi:MAG: DUF1345 domain-containing protein [Mucilaginibacter sp.]
MSVKTKKNDTFNLPNHIFFRLDAHYRIYFSLVAAAIAFFFVHNIYSVPAVILITWIAFAVAVIFTNWIIIIKAHPREIRKIARLQDSSRTLIFLFVITASVVSLGAILFLLHSSKAEHHGNIDSHIFLALASVIVSWWLVHTLFTMRYAHMYYDTDGDEGISRAYGGLDFPEEKEPDYLDFVYFSFVIGMTFQVSDVEISDRGMRRLAWLHGLVSFAFNTAIVALSINIISSLI